MKKMIQSEVIIILSFLLFISCQKGLFRSDGKIIQKTPFDMSKIESKFNGKINISKIIYYSDGLKVTGFMIEPNTTNRKFPVLIYNHGGHKELGSIQYNQLKYLSYICSTGYIILASQYRGIDGSEGKEDFGDSDVNDILALIKLANRIPNAIPGKIVMLGHSRGGLMTYNAIKKGAAIKCAATVGGISDLIQWYNNQKPMQKVLKEIIGADPNSDKEEYIKRSAIYWPEKINVPLLLLHGKLDQQVNVDQSIRLAEKLGNNAKIIVYPEGDHNLTMYMNEYNKEIISFFNEHLQ